MVTSFVSAEASATDETEYRRLRDMEACDWSIVRMEAADWLITTEVLRLRFGKSGVQAGDWGRAALGEAGAGG